MSGPTLLFPPISIDSCNAAIAIPGFVSAMDSLLAGMTVSGPPLTVPSSITTGEAFYDWVTGLYQWQQNQIALALWYWIQANGG